MPLFDDDDETEDDQQPENESGSWGVDEGQSSSAAADPDPLADLDTVSIADGGPSGTLKRAVDPEAGVVIYAYKNGNAGGLSTVPLSQTDLTDEG